MPPNDDIVRPRASSGAERQKSIVSMTEFEGMDEYTALQKYILFYRDTRTNPHAEKPTKKKAWWQFWKSGSATAAAPIEDAGAVPDERMYSLSLCRLALSPSALNCSDGHLRRIAAFVALLCRHLVAGPSSSCSLSSSSSSQCGRPIRYGRWLHRTTRRGMRAVHYPVNECTDSACSPQHPASQRSHNPGRRAP